MVAFYSSALVAVAISAFFDTVHGSCDHGTFLHKRVTKLSSRQEGGTAKTVAVGKFGYIGNSGPTQWASLDPAFSGCATNAVQSPIDITNTTTTALAPGSVVMNFPDVAAAEFENIGTTLEVVMEGKGASTTVNGKVFELKQFHFHTPSEHTIDGEYFPLEMHMVHENAEDKSIAVIAAHFQLSEGAETTELIKTIMEKIGEISTPGTVTETSPLAFGPLVDILSKQTLLEYQGSLTTPPCAEGLIFLVTSQQLPLDVASFNKVKAVVGFNSRFTQSAAGSPNLLAVAPKAVLAAAPVASEAVKVTEPTNAAEPAKAEEKESTITVVATKTEVSGESKAAETGGVKTIVAESGNVAEIVKGLTGLDLGGVLNLQNSQ